MGGGGQITGGGLLNFPHFSGGLNRGNTVYHKIPTSLFRDSCFFIRNQTACFEKKSGFRFAGPYLTPPPQSH